MTHAEALEVVARHRGECVVMSTMGSVGIWAELSDGPLDLAYVPSSMGQAPALGLGLALARPGLGVIVLNGDGCMLMNLGCLATIAAHPARLYLVVMENGVYEVTGGQAVVGAGLVRFGDLARGAGIPRVYEFAELADWQARAASALSGSGPAVICLKVAPRPGQSAPVAPRPMAEQLARLAAALGPPEALSQTSR